MEPDRHPVLPNRTYIAEVMRMVLRACCALPVRDGPWNMHSGQWKFNRHIAIF